MKKVLTYAALMAAGYFVAESRKPKSESKPGNGDSAHGSDSDHNNAALNTVLFTDRNWIGQHDNLHYKG